MRGNIDFDESGDEKSEICSNSSSGYTETNHLELENSGEENRQILRVTANGLQRLVSEIYDSPHNCSNNEEQW